jgi:hypothetical protein
LGLDELSVLRPIDLPIHMAGLGDDQRRRPAH